MDVLVRADAFVRTKGHDPYTRIGQADELIEELAGILGKAQEWAEKHHSGVIDWSTGLTYDDHRERPDIKRKHCYGCDVLAILEPKRSEG